MRTISIAAAASAALIMVGTGCYQTRIEQQNLSPEEQAWEAIIRESYPGYKAPPKTSRSVKGHTEERVSAVIRETSIKPMDDPAAPVQEPQELPAAEDPAEKTETAPAEKPAEIPADPTTPAVVEVKAETPAPAEKAEAAPAEKPAEKAEAAPAAKPAEKTAAAPAGNMPPDPTNSTVYVVKSGDTLGSIAQKNYGNARYSNVIFKANSDILKNPDKLRPGMKLIIPKL